MRDWLTRKQRETRRGFAELGLAERAAIWDSKPENRQLPSILEWARFRILTRPKDWTEAQRRMMGRAGRVHGLRAIGLAAALAVVASVSVNARNRVVAANRATASAAASRVQLLLKAEPTEIPAIIQSIQDDRRWTDPELKRVVTEPWYNPKAKLNASLSLLPVDPTQAAYLETRLRDAAPSELAVLHGALLPYRSGLIPNLWSDVAASKPGDHMLPVASRTCPLRHGQPALGQLQRESGTGAGYGRLRRLRLVARCLATSAQQANRAAGRNLP